MKVPACDQLTRCLDDLENRLVPEQEERILGEWRRFSDGDFDGDIFTPRREPSEPGFEWPKVRVNEALDDYQAMALQQYGLCSDQLAQGAGTVLNVRCNYGSSLLPSQFGVEPFIMGNELDCLPTSRPLHDSDAVRRLVDAGVPDPRAGLVPTVLEMAERFLEIGRRFPKIGRYVQLYHPDTQGPLDITEVVWGSEVLAAMYTEPELVSDFISLATETYIQFMRIWQDMVPFRSGGNAHWGFFFKGNLMLREDSVMNISPSLYRDLVRSHDQQLLNEFGGGAAHFCGRGDHYIEALCEMNGIHAVAMSQPEYNDMDVVFSNTVDKGINLIGLARSAAEDALRKGRSLRGRVHSS